MNVSRRSLLLGTASAAVIGAAISPLRAIAAMKVGEDPDSRALLRRMLRVMFPHAQFPDGPYDRTADAVLAAGNKTPAQALMMADGFAELRRAGFGDLDDAAALAHLKEIESSAFFQLARGTAVVSLYSDAEVWTILGYEGPSYDQGGYINRGFNDLDWLPDPRITEL
ncbi:MAG: hypothetical protein AAGG06_07725 [Pseudomonadota bacterium]